MGNTKNIKDLEKDKFVIDPVTGKVSVCVTGIDDPLCRNYTAAETISAVKAVYVSGSEEVSRADKGTKPEATVIGISKHAANATEDIEVVTYGELQDSSFTYTAGESIYLDSSGNLTTTAPTVGFLTKIGTALGNNKIFIDIQEPIEL